MGKTGRTNRRYDAEFKLRVILDMQEHHMDYRETVQKYWHEGQKENHKTQLKSWERIYLERGKEGLMEERRGRKRTKSTKKPLPPDVEEDLIAENQRLRMENEYFKKLQALVLADAQAKSKKRK